MTTQTRERGCASAILGWLILTGCGPMTDAGAPEDAGTDDAAVSTDAGPQAPGSVRVTWTLNGAAATAEACEALFAQTVVVATEAAGSAELPCSAGEHLVEALPPGEQPIALRLLDEGGLEMTSSVQSVAVESGAETPMAIDLAVSRVFGEFELAWAIDGDRSCPPGGTVALALTREEQRRDGSAPCTAGVIVIGELQPGDWSIHAELREAEDAVIDVFDVPAFPVAAGARSQLFGTFTCGSCPE